VAADPAVDAKTLADAALDAIAPPR
jgi:hypothetical protein